MRMQPETFKNIRKSFIFFSLVAGMFFLIFRYGLFTAVKISEFLQKNQPGYGETPLESYLPVPKFFSVIEATNSGQLPIEGYAPANEEILITLNDVEDQSLAVNSEGKFEDFLPLSLGTSKIYSVAITNKEIRSSPSKSWNIFYNDSPPYLEILEPENNSVIKGKQNTVIIRGKITPPAKAYVNDHLMIIDDENSFSYSAVLQTGENKFKIVSLDPALNKTEIEWLLNYQP